MKLIIHPESGTVVDADACLILDTADLSEYEQHKVEHDFTPTFAIRLAIEKGSPVSVTN